MIHWVLSLRKLLLICMMLPSFLFLQAQADCYWPSFHGPDRTNRSTESGLPDIWPENGPELAWSISGLGKGYSSVSIDGQRIYTAGTTDRQTFVSAFDLDGKLLWKKPNGQAWETERSHAISYTGSRSTPTVSDGVVYHLGELGRLTAMDHLDGREIWSRELMEDFDAEIPEYGYAESVLIEGERLYCCPAGNKAFIVCLDRHNGDLIWSNREIPGTVGFSSLVRFRYGGHEHLAGLSSSHLFGVDAETGKLLWLVEFGNSRDNNIADPVYHDGHVFASSGYGRGSILVQLIPGTEHFTTEIVWDTEMMDNHHGGVVLNQGYLYGSGQNSRGWTCLEFKTGKVMWKTGGKGSLTYADGKLYCLDERGIMNLVNADPGNGEVISSFELPEGGQGMHWAHPVVCGRRLYIRHDDSLFVYRFD
jgi:outer membrane protein assembly factor BamB